MPAMILWITWCGTRLHHGEFSHGDASAAVFLKMIWTGQRLFATACGNAGYATSIAELAVPLPGSSDGFLNPESLERVTRDYVVQITSTEYGPIGCLGRPTAHGFIVTAVPIVFGESGRRRSFTLAPDGTIWYSESAIAPTEPFDVTGKKLQ